MDAMVVAVVIARVSAALRCRQMLSYLEALFILKQRINGRIKAKQTKERARKLTTATTTTISLNCHHPLAIIHNPPLAALLLRLNAYVL